MPVAASSGRTSVILEGYGYVLKQKKIFLESNGLKGANVVSTNSSFGVDYANCESGEYPVWNDIYNEMGKYGILSAAATINGNVNVDERGDVPTGCSSPYLITVTNTDSTNKKYRSAGYGANAIDLGAPGTNILSTLPSNRIGTLTGTSMATPHIAGAVALIHAAASKDLNSKYFSNPAETALIFKQVLLDSVSPIASLKGKTVTGGKLNLKNAVDAVK
jgi:subtilisin family serine protease